MSQGRIPTSEIEAIREKAAIEEIVGDYVQITPAGSDSWKGLSPFKDEKTPSFHVRPMKGYYHCFSTGKGGDVFSFVMEMEHVSFPEAVELVASRINHQIRYEGNPRDYKEAAGTRQRLVAANRAAHDFYMQQLHGQEEGAQKARTFLQERGFSKAVVETFECGYAPDGWDTLTKYLLRKGFDFKELEAAGLSKMGKRGPIDRFHRRLLWPIKNTSGDVIGFGARKLFDDDKLGKYLNTPETMLYKKSKVLFGLDLAKKNIAAGHKVVVVEGYTDVMAMHAAGVTTAVAACGTAFGEDHLKLIRRLIMDDKFFQGEIVYTFDGDEAGQKAAVRAFEGDQAFTGKSYVAVAPDGLDPCDLRLERGDEALVKLTNTRIPLFEFIIRKILAGFDTSSVEGRVQAKRQIVPILSDIHDIGLRDEYARQAAGWIGWDNPNDLITEVRQAARKNPKSRQQERVQASQQLQQAPALTTVDGGENRIIRPNPRDHYLQEARESIKIAVQQPETAGMIFDALQPESFIDPAYIAIAEAIKNLGGVEGQTGGPTWVSRVQASLKEPQLIALVGELVVEPIPCEPSKISAYSDSVIARLQEQWYGNFIADMKSQLQRMRRDQNPREYDALFKDMVELEKIRKSLLVRIMSYVED